MLKSLRISILLLNLEQGDFTMDNARLRLEYLDKYMIQDREFNRHRMHLIINKEGKNGAPHIARACINVEFDIIFD